MTTVQALIDRVRRDQLLQGRIEGRNKLAADVSSSATTFTFVRDLDGIVPHARISIGLEDIYIWSTTPASKTADVDRGADSTTAVAHTTTEIVRVSPAWSDSQILRSINDALVSFLGDGLFGVGAYEFVYQAPAIGIPLPADVIEVLEVSVQDFVGADWVPLRGWDERHNQNTTDFPTGNAVFLVAGTPLSGRTVRVEYAKDFASLSTLTQDVETVTGISSSMIDVLAKGAAIEVTGGREIGKNLGSAQGSTRRSSETPAGSEARARVPVILDYERRVSRERDRLRRKYPERMRNP